MKMLTILALALIVPGGLLLLAVTALHTRRRRVAELRVRNGRA